MSRIFSGEVTNAPVMVRAYGDEPVRLLARTHLVDAVELGFEEGGNPIYFPAEDVYLFDQRLFTELRDAYANGKKTQLIKAWDKAERYTER